MAIFKNTYLIMRHGESEANVADLVVSNPDIGCAKYGLTPLGKSQAEKTAMAYSGEKSI